MPETLWENTRNQRDFDDICYNRNDSFKQPKKSGEGIGRRRQDFFGNLKIICLSCYVPMAWTFLSGVPGEKNDRVCTTGQHWVQNTPDRLYLFDEELVESIGKIHGGNIAWKDSVHGRAHHLTAQTKQYRGRLGTDHYFHTATVSMRLWSLDLQHCNGDKSISL